MAEPIQIAIPKVDKIPVISAETTAMWKALDNNTASAQLIIDTLKQDKEHINAKHGPRAETCLHYASRRNEVEAVEWLLTNGADASLQDKAGNSAWDLVLINCQEKTAALVINESREARESKQAKTMRAMHTFLVHELDQLSQLPQPALMPHIKMTDWGMRINWTFAEGSSGWTGWYPVEGLSVR